MSTSDAEPLLRSIPLFADLGDTELAEILAFARVFAIPGGETIFRQGDQANGMYVLAEGRVRVTERLLGEDEVELSILGPGEVLGEFSLVDRGIRSATARTLEATSGLFFESRHFSALRSDLNSGAFKTMRRIGHELAERLCGLDAQIAARAQRLTIRPLPSWVTSEPPARTIDPTTLDRRVLRTLPFFGTLSADELTELFQRHPIREAPKGTIFFRQGEGRGSCFIVIRRAVEVVLETASGIESLAVLGPGRIFGVGLGSDGARSATCFARERAIVLEIARADFQELMQGRTTVAFKFFDAVNELLIAQLRATNRRLGRLAVEEAHRDRSS
jgi:CRP/FNR family transcriptional regulator, cyclic AMP receptor protein